MHAFVPLLLLASSMQEPPGPRFEKLDNGLRICIVEDHSLPLVSVQLWFKVGSSYDPPDKPGLTHVAQTLLEQRSNAATELAAAGLHLDSGTLHDACYSATLLPADSLDAATQPTFLDFVLRTGARRFQARATSNEELGTALTAAGQRYGRDIESPQEDSCLDERQFLAAMFPNHPYQHPPEFVADSLKDLQPAVLDEHVQRWFAPENATLFIVGDVTPDQALRIVRTHFGNLPWRDTPARADFDSPRDQRIELRGPSSTYTELKIAWVTPPHSAFENAALDVLMYRLCNPIDGPLRARLSRARYGEVRWTREAYRHAGVLELTIGPTEGASKDPAGDLVRHDIDTALGKRAAAARAEEDHVSNAADLERIVREELRTASASLSSEIELNRARASTALGVAASDDDVFGRAFKLAQHEIVGGDLLLSEYELPRIRRVAAGELQLVARLLLESRSVVELTDTGQQKQRADSFAMLRPIAVKETRDNSRRGPLDDTLRLGSKLPRIGQLRSRPKIITHTLENEIRVILCPVAGARLVDFRCALARPLTFPFDIRELLLAGADALRADQLRDLVSYRGWSLTRSRSTATLRGVCPRDDLAPMNEFQASIVRAARHTNVLRSVGLSTVRIIVVGDFEPQAALDSIRGEWASLTFPPPTADPNAPTGGDNEPPAQRGPWRAADSDHQVSSPPTYVRGRIGPVAVPPLDSLATHWVLAQVLTQPFGRTSDVSTGPRWFCYANAQRTHLDMRETIGNCEALAREFIDRLDDLLSSRVNASVVDAALARARVERLVDPSGVASIATVLEDGTADPWDVALDANGAQFLRDLPAALRNAPVELFAACDPASSDALLRDLNERLARVRDP